MESLKYFLKKQALKGITNAVTEKQYRRHIGYFATWAKQTHQIRLASDVVDSCALLQDYANDLTKKEYPPDTIHSYLAPVAKGFGLSLAKIDKPKRSSSTINKTRKPEANKQGQRELGNVKNTRLVEAAKVLGVRRDELVAITGDCLMRDYAGNLCVLVRSGKGGKRQMQRILPKDEAFVVDLFSGIAPRQRVFSRDELKNKIPIHALRRSHAQEAYDFYLHRVQTGHRQELIDDIKAYFAAYHAKMPGAAGERHLAKQFTRFCQDLSKGDGLYRLRGENLLRAKRSGRPVVYDRVALMATSVFHLAHWRNDVTARNYML